MKLSELHKVALEKGADPVVVDNALDSDNPRNAINAVIRSLGDSPRRLRVYTRQVAPGAVLGVAPTKGAL